MPNYAVQIMNSHVIDDSVLATEGSTTTWNLLPSLNHHIVT